GGGGLGKGDGGRQLVAVPGPDLCKLSEVAGRDALAERHERRHETAPVADLENEAGAGGDPYGFGRLLGAKAARLFAQDRYACMHECRDEFQVEVGRRRDDRRVDPVRTKKVVQMGERREPEGVQLLANLQARLDDSSHLDAASVPKRAEMCLAHAPGADEANTHRSVTCHVAEPSPSFHSFHHLDSASAWWYVRPPCASASFSK